MKRLAMVAIALLVAACSAPTAPVSSDSIGSLCNSGVVIRTGVSCDGQ